MATGGGLVPLPLGVFALLAGSLGGAAEGAARRIAVNARVSVIARTEPLWIKAISYAAYDFRELYGLEYPPVTIN